MKKNLIKSLFILPMLFLLTLVLVACSNDFKPDRKVSVIMPSGTPVLALGGVIDENNDIEVVTDTSLLQVALTTNSADIVICPLTMATNLYLKDKSTYKLEAIVTYNNAYLISKNSLDDYSDLNGKFIVGFNETNTPGIILKMFLEQNNIEAELQFEANVNASVNAFTNGNTEYAVVAEPQLTKIKKVIPDLNVLNLGELVSETFIPQAAIFVKADVCDDANVKFLLERIEENIKFMNDKPNEYIDSVINNHPYFNTIGADVLKDSIPTINVSYLKASENKDTIESFYKNVDKYVNNFFGGNTPDEGFYN